MSLRDRMTRWMATKHARDRYTLRKQTVGPVFGQVKSCMSVRQFLLRGLAKVKAECALVCLCHNIRKLYVNCPVAG